MKIDINVVRNFWNPKQTPGPERRPSKLVVSEKYFREVSDRKFRVEPHIPEFADYSKYEGKKVLEIGCGIGTDAEQFINAGANYTGIDLNEELVEIAQCRLPGNNAHTIRVENIESWCSDEKYDLIYSFGSLSHTPNIHLALANIRKMLAPQGELKIMVQSRNSWKRLMISLGLEQPEPATVRTYTFEELTVLLSDFNIELSKDHIFQYDMDSYIGYEYKKTRFWENMPECITRFLETHLGQHTLVTGLRK